MTLTLFAEIGPPRTDLSPSLQESFSGWRWSKLKEKILKYRGPRCEVCGAQGVPLDAHEVWEYVDAKDAGLDPEYIYRALAERRLLEERLQEVFYKLRRTENLTLGFIIHSDKALVRGLTDIKLLCKSCHVCNHSYNRKYMKHWCKVNRQLPEEFHRHYRDVREKWKGYLVIRSVYSGYEELPDYKTLAEWQEARTREADACDEDDWICAENAMNDSGFLWYPGCRES